MRMKNVLAFFTIGALLAALSSTSWAATYYRWKDEHGVTHYTLKPPPEGIEAEEVRTYNSSSSDQADALRRLEQQREQTAQELAERENPEQAMEDRCARLRQNLQTLQEEAVVSTQDPESGEQRILGDEERATMLEQTQRAVDACEAEE